MDRVHEGVHGPGPQGWSFVYVRLEEALAQILDSGANEEELT